jgi:hypothetical protein
MCDPVAPWSLKALQLLATSVTLLSMSEAPATPVAPCPDPEVQAAIDRALEGVRDPDSIRQAAERMDKMREEMRARVGNVNPAVPLIRETRDEE